MGSNAVLRRLVHLVSTYLDFKRLAAVSNQCRVKGLVHIGLGHGNIILETPRYRFIHLMNHTQRRIAVLHRVHDDAHRKQIINLVNGFILVLHFFVDTEKMLHPAVNLGFDACIDNMLTDLVYDILNIFLPHAFAHGNFIHQIIISFRL